MHTLRGGNTHVPKVFYAVALMMTEDLDTCPRGAAGTGDVDTPNTSVNQTLRDGCGDTGTNFFHHDGPFRALHQVGDGLRNTAKSWFTFGLNKFLQGVQVDAYGIGLDDVCTALHHIVGVALGMPLGKLYGTDVSDQQRRSVQ
jgi:hypothetical protein